MAEPFLSEIRMMSFAFAPRGWALCNGQLLPINQNQALFSLLGTTYGGNGQVNFALPDLRARTPIHDGGGYTLGQRGGEQAHTLAINEMPSHSHTVRGSSVAGSESVPVDRLLAANTLAAYRPVDAPLVPMASGTLGNTGGSQAHLNMQPFLTISFCIALQGIFPSPN